jgi:toxin ParE1/3/4
MAFSLIIKPIVFSDAEEAVLFYNKRVTGLGKRFYNSLLTALTQIQLSPFAYSYIKEPVRRLKIEKFPYKVFYIINTETVIIIGISHAKRSNAFVKRRLRLLE